MPRMRTENLPNPVLSHHSLADMLTALPQLAVGAEDSIFLTLTVAASLYFCISYHFGPPHHEQERLSKLFSVPQKQLQQANGNTTTTIYEEVSRNICHALEPPSVRTPNSFMSIIGKLIHSLDVRISMPLFSGRRKADQRKHLRLVMQPR